MRKTTVVPFCLLAAGWIRNTYHIAPEFHGSGSIHIDGRTDADDPQVTATVDDVTMDWKEIKELVEIGDFPNAESAQIAADEFTRREKMESAVRPFGKL